MTITLTIIQASAAVGTVVGTCFGILWAMRIKYDRVLSLDKRGFMCFTIAATLAGTSVGIMVGKIKQEQHNQTKFVQTLPTDWKLFTQTINEAKCKDLIVYKFAEEKPTHIDEQTYQKITEITGKVNLEPLFQYVNVNFAEKGKS